MKPNIIIMLMDNLGYGDLGCYGSTKHRTPNVDRLAREGIRLTSFYSASGVCTPSRASLMTGCYPRRLNMHVSGRGYDTSEGSQRVPCLARWPGTIPAETLRDDLATMMDILPTAARLAGTTPPAGRIIDGKDIFPILTNDPAATSPYDETGFFYYYREQLQAVRAGPWKLYLPLALKLARLDGNLAGAVPAQAKLYDVRNDIGETRELSAEHPEIVQRLLELAEQARTDLGDLGREGANQRPAGWVDTPEPRLLPQSGRHSGQP